MITRRAAIGAALAAPFIIRARAADTLVVTAYGGEYQDVFVPAENLLGDLGLGHKIAFNILNIGRLKLGAAALGAARECLEFAVRYAEGFAGEDGVVVALGDAVIESRPSASPSIVLRLINAFETHGAAAAFAVHRFRFFGRETVSFALVLPIALPGIVTGMALNSAINFGGQIFGLSFGLLTIIVG